MDGEERHERTARASFNIEGGVGLDRVTGNRLPVPRRAGEALVLQQMAGEHET
jgi:hypothetical protein